MKILHLSTWETGGAAKAASRLSSALNALGHDSHVVHMSSRFYAYLDAAIGKLHHPANPIFHSYNYFGVNLRKIISQYQPDILHLHWIGAGFVRPESLLGLKLPIVWTLHDLWPLLGAEHLPCRQAGLPANFPHRSWMDFNSYLIARKASVYQQQPIHFIAPSHYVYKLAKRQSLLGNNSLTYIPNGIDITVFRPHLKQSEKKTILFLANNPELDNNKGFPDFQSALSLLPQSLLRHYHPHIVSGGIAHDKELATIYQRAAVVVVPSRLETLSYVAMEALACGTPVVAYRVGGIPDLVQHRVSGYLARPYVLQDLAHGITLVLQDPALAGKWGQAGRRHISNDFALTRIANTHLSFYSQLLNKRVK